MIIIVFVRYEGQDRYLVGGMSWNGRPVFRTAKQHAGRLYWVDGGALASWRAACIVKGMRRDNSAMYLNPCATVVPAWVAVTVGLMLGLPWGAAQ